MNAAGSLVLACAAMALLVAIVAVRMLLARIAEMKANRVHPQAVATSRQMAEKLHKTQAADNYRNLFEMPVLFYALCALLIATSKADAFFVWGAWVFVVLRYVHSYIHVSYNKVMHRLAAFASSGAVLAVLWVRFAFQNL